MTRQPASRFCRAAWLALSALLLAGCVALIDADQARVCRSALPALNPGARVTVLTIASGPSPRTLRVDYEVLRDAGPPLDRFIVCRFAAEGLSANKAELVEIATELGPLSGANLYFLKRAYLESPEGVAGDPGSPPAVTVPEIPAPAAYLSQQLIVGMPRTAIYGLLAVAFSLVFGLTGRINFAFGEIAAIGSAATVSATALVLAAGSAAPGIGLAAGLAAAMFAGAIHSVVGGALIIGRVRSASTQPSLIAAIGLSLFLMEYLRLAQGPVTVWLAPFWVSQWPVARAGAFVVALTLLSIVTTAIGLAAAGFLVWLMRTSTFGRNWRAFSDDAAAAALFGVDRNRLLTQTLAVSGAMAGLSGMLVVAQYGGLGFAGGFQFGLKALIAAIIGGIGSAPGALAGGLLVGLYETLWSAYLPIEARDMALYGALIVFLILRPGGLLGQRGPTPRPV